MSAEISQPDVELVNIVSSYSDQKLFNEPSGIFFDSFRKEIYLADPGNHQIGIFDLKGTNIWSFVHWVDDFSSGERMPGAPHSMVVTKSGNIIVSDNQALYLDVVDYRGQENQRIEPKDYPNIKSFAGAPIALDKNGNLYIGIMGDDCEILKLDHDFNLVMRFGQKGKAPEQFDNIAAIYIDDDGKIYVSDIFAEPAIKIFDESGSYLSGFGQHEEAKNDFSLPAGIVKTRGGRIWVLDTIRQVVKCLSGDGEYVTMIGGLGQAPGDMWYPSSVTSDGDSILIVSERVGNRYQQFTIK